jgi:hypothetical protein
MNKNRESGIKKTFINELMPKEIRSVSGGTLPFMAAGQAAGTMRLLTSLLVALSIVIWREERNSMLKVASGALALQMASSATDFIGEKPFNYKAALWIGLLKTHGSVWAGIIAVWIYSKFLYPLFGEEKK